MRANETAARGLVPINSLMTSLNSSSISMIGCGMSRREKMYRGGRQVSTLQTELCQAGTRRQTPRAGATALIFPKVTEARTSVQSLRIPCVVSSRPHSTSRLSPRRDILGGSKRGFTLPRPHQSVLVFSRCVGSTV